MKRLFLGFLIGSIISLPWLSFSYLGYKLFDFPFIPVILFEWIIEHLPDNIINFSLEMMIQSLNVLKIGSLSSSGKIVEFVLAIFISIFGLGSMGGVFNLLAQPQKPWGIQGGLLGVILWIASILLIFSNKPTISSSTLSLLWMLFISFAWSLWTTRSVTMISLVTKESLDGKRRNAINQLWINSLALGVLALGLERLFSRTQGDKELSTIITPTPQPTDKYQTIVNQFQPVPGTRLEITPIGDFFRVDINLLPPDPLNLQNNSENLANVLAAQGGEIDTSEENYLLQVDGLVETPLVLDLATIKTLPVVEQYATLSCISNPIAGDLIGTTKFKGVSLKYILEKVGIKPGVNEIKFTCADGYTESLPIESALNPATILCYSMGDQPLSKNHGAPIRLLTPNRYGMKNPKWIVKIEAIGDSYSGYWEQRGWDKDAWIQPTAVIDTFRKISQNVIEVGGIAFTGSRGIQSVEIRLDDGDWRPCLVKEPLSQFSWSLWRISVDISPGKHRLYVRVIDGNGEVQTEERNNTFPRGATGYHSIKIEIK